MHDTLTRQVLTARPSTAGDDGWAHTAAGRSRLAAVLRAGAPARRRHRLMVAGAGVAVVLGGGVTAVAAIGSAPPRDRQMVLCSQGASLDADGAGLTLHDGSPAAAAQACAANWSRMFPGTPRPQRFAVCVYPARTGQRGGGQVAVPARAGDTDYAVCRSLGTVPAR